MSAATANAPDGPALAPALAVTHLRTEFRIQGAWHPAVDDISFSIARRETLALVGESGCGKSITALSVMGLVPRPQGRIAAGRILLDGTDLTKLPEPALEKLRGASVAMIFQEPMTSLNPVMTVGAQVAEALTVHQGLSRRAADAKALGVLDEVKIPSAAARFHDYPHQFSGGMRQRVMIAMAIACEPTVLLADEPTTALDVTIQAQAVLGLLADLRGNATAWRCCSSPTISVSGRRSPIGSRGTKRRPDRRAGTSRRHLRQPGASLQARPVRLRDPQAGHAAGHA